MCSGMFSFRVLKFVFGSMVIVIFYEFYKYVKNKIYSNKEKKKKVHGRVGEKKIDFFE